MVTLYGIKYDGTRFEWSNRIYFYPFIPFEVFYDEIITEFVFNYDRLELEGLYKLEVHIKPISTNNREDTV